MASYVVAASFFIIGSSYLLNFVIEPPGASGANLDHLALTSRAESALQLILGSPGYPASWDASTSAIDNLDRLGLIEQGTSIRIDADKFDALARGRYASASSGNGFVDYAEAKDALGLDGFDFHLRAYPVTEVEDGAAYGVTGFGGYRIAYVGAGAGGSSLNATAIAEAASLNALDVSFNPWLHAANATGDAFIDNSNALRQWLVPNLGATISQAVISEGAGTKYSFYRVEPSVYSAQLTLSTSGEHSTAMALSSSGSDIGYTKNREIRAILGSANFSNVETGQSATLEWKEWVDTGSSMDCGDYGFVEVSHDGGATWTRLTDTSSARSQDCSPLEISLARWEDRSVTISGTNCGSCIDKDSVLIAFHWIADNDNNVGSGWLVDNVTVEEGTDTLFAKTFSSPQYEMLIVGSETDHEAFVAAEIKDAIRDYVDVYGGRILVLGGQDNVQWLDRLFDAGVSGTSGGLSTPDTTHPILTLPNTLAYTGYSSSGTWDFSASDDADLFNMIIGSGTDLHTLSISKAGAFGDDPATEGAVMLTTYLPYKMSSSEASKFLANNIVYGRYHYLYAEVGPPIPDHEAIASVSRSATMNKMRTGDAEYIEMAFLLYIWPGASTSSTYATSSVTPAPPTLQYANASSGQVLVTWSAPSSIGTGTSFWYHIYRGHAPGYATTLVANVSNATRSYTDTTSITNGQTYYYNVTMVSNHGNGTASNTLSATPLGLPGVPTGVTATGVAGGVNVTWSAPASTGGGSILGYAVWADEDNDGAFQQVAEAGSSTWYVHTVAHTDPVTYKVAALTGAGWGSNSSTASGSALVAALAPQTVVATRSLTPGSIDLTWAAPASFGSGTHSGYKLYRSSDNSAWSTLVSGLSTGNVSFTDAGLGTGVTRYYRIVAETTVGDGLNSTTVSATTADVADAPSSVAVSNATVNDLVVSWVAPVQLNGGVLSGYKLWRSTDGGTNYALLADTTTLNALNVSFRDDDLGANLTRHYIVQAVTNVGVGTNASAASNKTMGVPYAPTNVAAGAVLTTTTVTWSAPYSESTVTSYEVWRSDTEGGTYTQVATVVGVTTHIEASTGKWFKIKAVSAAGTGNFSAADQA